MQAKECLYIHYQNDRIWYFSLGVNKNDSAINSNRLMQINLNFKKIVKYLLYFPCCITLIILPHLVYPTVEHRDFQHATLKFILIGSIIHINFSIKSANLFSPLSCIFTPKILQIIFLVNFRIDEYK